MKAAAAAAENSLLWKIDRSSIGARWWRSTRTNAGRKIAAAISPPITTGELQPEIPPLEIPNTSPVSPIRNVTVPAKSNRRSSERPVISCRINAAHRLPASPSGTLNQNTQCQEIATSAPPSTGPITRPTAATIVLVPIARPSCSRGNESVTIAAALANRNEPPIPWRIRHRISCVPLAANPAPSDAAANSTNPPI